MSQEEIHKLILEVTIRVFEAIGICSFIPFGIGYFFGKQAGIQEVINDIQEDREDKRPCMCPACREERETEQEMESEEGEDWKDN